LYYCRVKKIEFLGDSLDVLRGFPARVRRMAGFQLDRVQRGLEPFDWKPMTSIGPGVREIRARDDSNASEVTAMAMSKASVQRFSSVWDAIEASREVAASLRLRAEVANAIIEEAGRRGLTQARVADLCGVTQPRISDLMRGRLDLFSLDGLIDMAAQLGLRTRLTLSRSKAA